MFDYTFSFVNKFSLLNFEFEPLSFMVLLLEKKKLSSCKFKVLVNFPTIETGKQSKNVSNLKNFT